MSQESIVACHTDTESLCVVGFFRFKRLRDAATRLLTIRCVYQSPIHARLNVIVLLIRTDKRDKENSSLCFFLFVGLFDRRDP